MTAQKQDWLDFFSVSGESPRTARLFRNGKNQAVRLPKELEFVDIEEVLVYRAGTRLVIEPKRPTWLDLGGFPPVGDDFLSERPRLGIESEDGLA